MAARNIAPPTRAIYVHGKPRNTIRISFSRMAVSANHGCTEHTLIFGSADGFLEVDVESERIIPNTACFV